MLDTALRAASTVTPTLDKSLPKPRLAAPSQIAGYRIVREIGTGSSGTVYVAEDPIQPRQVALKFLHSGIFDQEAREQLLLKARLLAQLDHEHLVRVLKLDEERGELVIVMELLHGESLQSRLKREHRLQLPEALRLARELALGLAAIHDSGGIHSAIAPSNLWLEKSGRLKLLECGLDSPSTYGFNGSQRSFSSSLAYRSPEQVADESVRPSSDFFALGAVLYRMVTGEAAFVGDHPQAVVRAIIASEPAAPRSINPEVSVPLEQYILRLLAKAEHNRPHSAQEIVKQLTDFCEPDQPKSSQSPETKIPGPESLFLEFGAFLPAPTQIKATPPPSRPTRNWKEHAIAAIVLIVATLGLWFWWKHSQPTVNQPQSQSSTTSPTLP